MISQIFLSFSVKFIIHKLQFRMATINSLNINEASINYGKPNGLNWITAALFLIADMAGAGIVAFPSAMKRSGKLFSLH